MITVISGTNRPDSSTLTIAKWCMEKLTGLGEECQLLDLTKLNIPILASSMYEEDSQHPCISALQEKFLMQSEHWLVISPEYNGSFPGVLKLFIDAVSVSQIKETFSGKKVSLLGISSGRAGNFRGMEHLTGIFNYLNVVVMPNKLPISSIKNILSPDGNIEEPTTQVLEAYIDEMLDFFNVESHQNIFV